MAHSIEPMPAVSIFLSFDGEGNLAKLSYATAGRGADPDIGKLLRKAAGRVDDNRIEVTRKPDYGLRS
jgi:hypothetical protein